MKFLSQLFANKKNTTENTDELEEVSSGSKIKIIAALLIVGFSIYVAWWVQEPADVRTDVLSGSSTTQTQSSTQDTQTQSDTEASQAGTSADVSVAATTETSALTREVSITNFTFDPAELDVPKGTTVVWVNRDTVPQTVSGDTFSSGTLSPGQSYSFTFKDEGKFDYYSSFYPQMKGTIMVKSGENPKTSTTEDSVAPADGTLPTSSETAVGTSPELTAKLNQENKPSLANLTELNTTPIDSNTASASLTPEQLAANFAADTQVTPEHGSALESGKLASSGPEDYLYLGAFVLILFLNRRGLLAVIK